MTYLTHSCPHRWIPVINPDYMSVTPPASVPSALTHGGYRVSHSLAQQATAGRVLLAPTQKTSSLLESETG